MVRVADAYASIRSDDSPEVWQAALPADDLQGLFVVLQRRGFVTVGPTVRDGAIVYDELATQDGLPVGWTERQAPGRYRLERRQDDALFGFTVGPSGWKRFLHPPEALLWRARRSGNGFVLEEPEVETAPAYAFMGVRACELAAIQVQDRVFLEGDFIDPIYAARRKNLFIVAVNCGQAAETCFCTSMNSGPGVAGGFDLALTELWLDGEHLFFVEAGSDAGVSVLAEIPHRPITERIRQAAEEVVQATVEQIQRSLNTDGLGEILQRNSEHPRWEVVAERCLTCGNCTLVCPTCFCTTVEDGTDLTGRQAERRRVWDSCFNTAFSYMHGGSVRSSSRSRYRQWLTHKLSTWQDQFGMSGCVGCGRCITWCPVGIDITEEATAIRSQAAPSP